MLIVVYLLEVLIQWYLFCQLSNCLFVYSTQIVLRDAEPVVMTSSQCSCKAGTAVCNHTVALLFQTAHYSELNIQVVPPVHACTETEQQWHKPRTAVRVEANVLYMYV